MIHWEYECIRHNLQKAFIDEVNKAGVDGWELVAVEKDSQNYYMGFLKRPVDSPGESYQLDGGRTSISNDREKARAEASRLAALNSIFNHDK